MNVQQYEQTETVSSTYIYIYTTIKSSLDWCRAEAELFIVVYMYMYVDVAARLHRDSKHK